MRKVPYKPRRADRLATKDGANLMPYPNHSKGEMTLVVMAWGKCVPQGDLRPVGPLEDPRVPKGRLAPANPAASGPWAPGVAKSNDRPIQTKPGWMRGSVWVPLGLAPLRRLTKAAPRLPPGVRLAGLRWQVRGSEA